MYVYIKYVPCRSHINELICSFRGRTQCFFIVTYWIFIPSQRCTSSRHPHDGNIVRIIYFYLYVFIYFLFLLVVVFLISFLIIKLFYKYI